MELVAKDAVFNVQAMMLGSATMLFCLAIQAFFAHAATRSFKPRIERLMTQGRPFAAQAAFLFSVLVLLISHLLQIYVWGLMLHVTGLQGLHGAMVFAGSTYTTVGFATNPLPIDWQLLTIIMAASGLFSFGWSTSVMVLLTRTLYPSEQ